MTTAGCGGSVDCSDLGSFAASQRARLITRILEPHQAETKNGLVRENTEANPSDQRRYRPMFANTKEALKRRKGKPEFKTMFNAIFKAKRDIYSTMPRM